MPDPVSSSRSTWPPLKNTSCVSSKITIYLLCRKESDVKTKFKLNFENLLYQPNIYTLNSCTYISYNLYIHKSNIQSFIYTIDSIHGVHNYNQNYFIHVFISWIFTQHDINICLCHYVIKNILKSHQFILLVDIEIAHTFHQ